jgi:hypothetical protein
LDEEEDKSNHAGLAQTNGFWLCNFCMICCEAGTSSKSITPDREECNKWDLTIARVSGLPFL